MEDYHNVQSPLFKSVKSPPPSGRDTDSRVRSCFMLLLNLRS